jgi:hypothetical protein
MKLSLGAASHRRRKSMAFPDLTAAEERLCDKLKEGFPSLKIDTMPGDLQKFVSNKLKSTRGVALVQFVNFRRTRIDESRDGWDLTFEVTILNKQLTNKGHQGVHSYIEQSINALHRDSTSVSNTDYTFLIDQGGFTGVLGQIWEYAFTVKMVPSLTL